MQHGITTKPVTNKEPASENKQIKAQTEAAIYFTVFFGAAFFTDVFFFFTSSSPLCLARRTHTFDGGIRSGGKSVRMVRLAIISRINGNSMVGA
jgi:hypothetical protein